MEQISIEKVCLNSTNLHDTIAYQNGQQKPFVYALFTQT